MNLRKNISVPEDVWMALEAKIPPGERSCFISNAIKKAMEEEARKLASEYKEAFSSDEYKQVQNEWGLLDTEGWE